MRQEADLPRGPRVHGHLPQRLIINLTPSSSLQRPITGDIRSLPSPPQWCMIELCGTEYLVWSSEDMRCCFYIFNLPPAWLPYYILEKRIEGSGLGRPGEMLRLAVNVLPMGWLSAVGVCQSLHRELLIARSPGGAGLPPGAELRKDRAPQADQEGRLTHFFQAYIDNFDEGRVVSQSGSATGPSSWQKEVRGAYQHWGAARAKDKAVEQSERGSTLGGEIHGRLGAIAPSDKRLAELLSIAWWARGTSREKGLVLWEASGSSLCSFVVLA